MGQIIFRYLLSTDLKNKTFPMSLKTINIKPALSLLFTLSMLLVNGQRNQSTSRIAITAKRMIDVRSGKEIPDVVIIIDNNKISEVGSKLKIPDSLKILPLGDVT